MEIEELNKNLIEVTKRYKEKQQELITIKSKVGRPKGSFDEKYKDFGGVIEYRKQTHQKTYYKPSELPQQLQGILLYIAKELNIPQNKVLELALLDYYKAIMLK